MVWRMCFLAMALIWIAACNDRPTLRKRDNASAGIEDSFQIPFARLVARPEMYDGKVVRLTGCVAGADDWSEFRIYPDKERADACMRYESIYVAAEDQELRSWLGGATGLYVSVEGTFDARGGGDWAGMITGITRILQHGIPGSERTNIAVVATLEGGEWRFWDAAVSEEAESGIQPRQEAATKRE